MQRIAAFGYTTPTGTERIRYDAAGNITKKTAPEQYDKETDDGPGYCYDYDCVNRLVQITDPQGQVVRRYVTTCAEIS